VTRSASPAVFGERIGPFVSIPAPQKHRAVVG
jgi:hypothetical protein